MVAYTVPDAGKAALDRYGIVNKQAEVSVRGFNKFHDARVALLTEEYREFLGQIGCPADRIESEVARFVRLHG